MLTPYLPNQDVILKPCGFNCSSPSNRLPAIAMHNNPCRTPSQGLRGALAFLRLLLLLKAGLRPPPISLHLISGSLHLKTQQANPHIHYILFRVHYILIQAVQRAPYIVSTQDDPLFQAKRDQAPSNFTTYLIIIIIIIAT